MKNIIIFLFFFSISYSQDKNEDKLTKETFYTYCLKSQKFEALKPIVFGYVQKHNIKKDKLKNLIQGSCIYYAGLLYPFYENKITEKEMKEIIVFLNTDIGKKFASSEVEALQDYNNKKDKKEVVKGIEDEIEKIDFILEQN